MTVCLVTGGAGFIGSHLVDRLVVQGHRVRVLDDLSTGNLDNLSQVRNRIELELGTILDAQILRRVMNGVDFVFHLAALPSVRRSIEDPSASHSVCATGTLTALLAAREEGIKRFIYAASSSAYGDLAKTNRQEDDPVLPLSPYAAAKLAGEHYCAAFTKVYGLETVRLRFFNIFGPRQRADNPYSGVIPTFLRLMMAGIAPVVDGDGLQSRDFTYVENAVNAMIAAAHAPGVTGNVYNVGAGGSTTINDLLNAINDLLGTRLQPIAGPPRPGDVRHSRADISRARQVLGYAPKISFHEGLARTIATFSAG